MKVLLLCDRLEAGGVETHVVSLARGLALRGVRVTVASGGGRLAEELKAEGFSHIALPLPSHVPLRLLSARRQLKRLVRKEGFQLLHAHTRLTAFLASDCRRWKNPDGSHPRCLVTAHAKFGGGALLRLLSRWGDGTLAVSEDLRCHLTDTFHLSPYRLWVIPNGIDCARFSPVERPLPATPLSILFASRLDADCSLGAHLLLTLLPRLADAFPIRLTIAGGGCETEVLKKRARRINASAGRELVTLAGNCADMPQLLREHHIFVGVSRAAMEAAATGLGVILCGNEGYGGILNERSAPLAALSNFCARGAKKATPDLLLADLCRLLGDASYRETCAHEGREYVLTHCNADRVCEETLSLYRRLSVPKRRGRVLFGGYFGCSNLGDDAMLMGSLALLHRLSPEMEPWALTGGGGGDREKFGVGCLNRKNPLSILYGFLSCDLFLLGGGSLLQSASSRRSLFYYTALLRLSRILGCKTVLFAGGVGPFSRPDHMQKVAHALEKCHYIGLRDQVSAHLLRTRGVPEERLHTGGDPALFLPTEWKGQGEMLLRMAGLDPTCPYLGVAVSSAPDAISLLSQALTALEAQTHVVPLIFSLTRQDEKAADALAKALRTSHIPVDEPSKAVLLIGACRGILSMRLHGLVFATLAGVPALAITARKGESKLASFAREAEQSHLFWEDCTPEELLQALKTILSLPFSPAPLWQMRKKAEKDLENILNMVYNKGR